eukprot:Skav233605  [mRNA]  locus=scaffold109:61868:65444:+ [translate_table: standard]
MQSRLLHEGDRLEKLCTPSEVGKSALVYRFINNKLLADPKATVGISFFKQTLWDPVMNQQYPLQIWDTAGQEKFQSVTTHHYRAADGALLVFDIANERSFQNLDKWLSELRENTDPSVVVALVGTKTDLAAQRQVPSERAQSPEAQAPWWPRSGPGKGTEPTKP